MAYTAGALHLRAGAPGELSYSYDAGDDTMAQVLVSGYFNNKDDGLNLVAEDLIFCMCTDGNMMAKVSAVVASTGVVTLQYAGGNKPINTWGTGTAAGDFGMKVGFYEVGTTVSTSSRGVLPTPYPGAEVIVRKIDSGTQSFDFDAGACASNISWVDGTVGGGTGVTYDGTNRRITLRQEGEGFHVVASSTSRWRLMSLSLTSTGKDGSYAGEGASNQIGGT